MRHLLALPIRLLRLIGRFGRAREAVAAVEFALVLPVMLTMYLGSLELSQAISVDQRVNVIAGTIGDLVARANGTIDSPTTLNDYFQAAQVIISPFSTTGLKQVVSLVAVKTDGTTNVEWSQGYNGGVKQIAGSPYTSTHPIPAAMIALTKGTTTPYIVVSEASYSYLPLLGLFFKQPFQLYHQNFYLPRYPGDITCTNCS